MIATTPKPPYFTVIFTSVMVEEEKDYEHMSNKMIELAKKQEGFLGMESARNEVGIIVSYWNSLETIQHWKLNLEHSEAREKGRSTWYQKFKVRISKLSEIMGLKAWDNLILKKMTFN